MYYTDVNLAIILGYQGPGTTYCHKIMRRIQTCQPHTVEGVPPTWQGRRLHKAKDQVDSENHGIKYTTRYGSQVENIMEVVKTVRKLD